MKIQIEFENNTLVFENESTSVHDVFEGLQKFIGSNYKLSAYSMQYLDEDDDYVTIASSSDLKEAIELAVAREQQLKIFVKEQHNSVNSIPSNLEGKFDEYAKTKKAVEDNFKGSKSNFIEDIINNEKFREQFGLFACTFLDLLREDEAHDIVQAFVQALSAYELIQKHPDIVKFSNMLPFIAPRIQPFAFFLIALDPSTVPQLIDQFVNAEKNNECGMLLPPWIHTLRGCFGPLETLMGHPHHPPHGFHPPHHPPHGFHPPHHPPHGFHPPHHHPRGSHPPHHPPHGFHHPHHPPHGFHPPHHPPHGFHPPHHSSDDVHPPHHPPHGFHPPHHSSDDVHPPHHPPHDVHPPHHPPHDVHPPHHSPDGVHPPHHPPHGFHPPHHPPHGFHPPHHPPHDFRPPHGFPHPPPHDHEFPCPPNPFMDFPPEFFSLFGCHNSQSSASGKSGVCDENNELPVKKDGDDDMKKLLEERENLKSQLEKIEAQLKNESLVVRENQPVESRVNGVEDQLYEKEIDSLLAMGFGDEKLLRSLLKQYDGNVDSIVEVLS